MAITTVRDDILSSSTDFAQQGCGQTAQGDGNHGSQGDAAHGCSGGEPGDHGERPVPSFWNFDDMAIRSPKAATTITLN
jgi:hypothetical protein